MLGRRAIIQMRRSLRHASIWQRGVPHRLIIVLSLVTILNIAIICYATHHRGPSGALGDRTAESPHIRSPPKPMTDGEEDTHEGHAPQRAGDAMALLGRRFDTLPRLPPQASAFAVGFSNTTFEVERGRYDKLLSEDVGPVVQASKTFKDVHTYSHQGVLLPKVEKAMHADEAVHAWEPGALPERSSAELHDYEKRESRLDAYNPEVFAALKEAVGTAEFCDATDADYTPTKDAACIAYLKNPANWLSLKPLSSILLEGRTMKFLLSLRHYNMTAVMKLSQTRFVLEPAGEVVAYHFDRTLEFRRVPPTVWVQFPIDYLKAAAATLGSFYVHWFDSQVLTAKHSKGITSECKDNRVAAALGVAQADCLYVSLQLWMWDVDTADETIFSDYMSRLPVFPGTDDDEGVAEAEGNDGEESKRTSRALSASALRRLVAGEHWDQLAFDAIIGNEDRWEGHNSFALAACTAPDLPCRTARAKTRASEPSSRSSPRIIYVDQGSSFYRSRLSNNTVFSSFRSKPYCLVRRRTVERLERIAVCALRQSHRHGAVMAVEPVVARIVTGAAAGAEAKQVGNAIFKHLLQMRLPTGIRGILPYTNIKLACRRVWSILAHRTRCLSSPLKQSEVFF